MLEILNQQDQIKINPVEFEELTENALAVISEAQNKSVTIAFVLDEHIRSLNQKFRNKNIKTDVLSFPNEPDEFEQNVDFLGDIIISVEQAQRQAIENDLSLNLEIKQLILHGILHLCGYDHETDNGEMNELELKLRDKLDIN